MEIQTIRAQARTASHKGGARKLRAGKHIPAVAYGGKDGGLTISVDPDALAALRRSPLGLNQPVAIEVEGGPTIPMALLREVQRHPVSGKLLHADFLRIEESKKVLVKVPIRLTGKALGEEAGGRVNQPMRDLEVRCLPKDIPVAIVVDITPIALEKKLTVSQIAMPPGVEAVYRIDTTVVGVTGKKQADEFEAKPAAAAEGAEGAEGAAAEGGEAKAEGKEAAGKDAGKDAGRGKGKKGD
jgi:large subunit ribosomal protein L25